MTSLTKSRLVGADASLIHAIHNPDALTILGSSNIFLPYEETPSRKPNP